MGDTSHKQKRLVLTEDAKRFADPVTGKLELEAVLDGLLIDGLIEESNSTLLRSIARPEVGKVLVGPLERIAAGGWSNAHDPAQKIDLDFLTRWLARKTDIPWKRIDPLQIDVPAVTTNVASSSLIVSGTAITGLMLLTAYSANPPSVVKPLARCPLSTSP